MRDVGANPEERQGVIEDFGLEFCSSEEILTCIEYESVDTPLQLVDDGSATTSTIEVMLCQGNTEY